VITRRLIQVAEVDLGRQRTPEHERGDHIVPYLRSANVGDGALILDDVKSMNFTPKEQVFFSLRPGDVLVTEGSGSKETVGAAAVFNGEVATPVCFQNTLLRLRPRASLSDGRFLYWWMRHAHASGMVAAVTTGANIQHLGAESLRNMRIAVPAIDIQRRMADFLDDQVARIDETIRLREDQIDDLTARLTSFAHSAVTGDRYPHKAATDLAWSPRLPSHWPVARLATIAQIGTGHTPSRSESEYWQDCDIPWLTTTDVKHLRSDEIETLDDTEFHISKIGLENSAAVMHPAGTVALCRTASAGYSAIMGVPMSTSQDFAVWRPSPRLIPRYLLWCLRAMRNDLLDRLAMGSTHKTIYFPDLLSIRMPLPPINEQESIVEAIGREIPNIVAARSEMRAQIILLKERKRSLITAAVTGEFDILTASGRGVT
jgi:type I restriction enzyme S subunit